MHGVCRTAFGHLRLLWITCICIAIFATASLTKRTWRRFQTSPTVISMDRNKFVWNTSFPSLTVCPHKRIDDVKLNKYMKFVPIRADYVHDKAKPKQTKSEEKRKKEVPMNNNSNKNNSKLSWMAPKKAHTRKESDESVQSNSMVE